MTTVSTSFLSTPLLAKPGGGSGKGSDSTKSGAGSDKGGTSSGGNSSTLSDIKDGKLARYGLTAGAGVVWNRITNLDQTDHSGASSAMPYIEILPLLFTVHGRIARAHCVAELSDADNAQKIADQVAITASDLDSIDITDLKTMSIENLDNLTAALFGMGNAPADDYPPLTGADDMDFVDSIRNTFSNEDKPKHTRALYTPAQAGCTPSKSDPKRELCDALEGLSTVETATKAEFARALQAKELVSSAKLATLQTRMANYRVTLVLAAIDIVLANDNSAIDTEFLKTAEPPAPATPVQPPDVVAPQEAVVLAPLPVITAGAAAVGAAKNDSPPAEDADLVHSYNKQVRYRRLGRLLVRNRTGWWVGIPAAGCWTARFGIYLGLPSGFSVNSAAGKDSMTTGTRVSTSFTPRYSVGIALNLTSFVQILAGVTSSIYVDGNGANAKVWSYTFGIGGSLDILGSIFGK